MEQFPLSFHTRGLGEFLRRDKERSVVIQYSLN